MGNAVVPLWLMWGLVVVVVCFGAVGLVQEHAKSRKRREAEKLRNPPHLADAPPRKGRYL